MAEFWTIIEKNTAIRVPKHLQKILNLHGYNDAPSIKSITTKDIDSFEEFVKNEIEAYIGEDDDPKDFYHIYSDMKSKFRITTGERVKLKSVVDFVKDKLASEAGHNFFHQSEKHIQPTSIKSLSLRNNQLPRGENATTQSMSEFIDLTSPQSSPMDASVIFIDEVSVDSADQLIIDEGIIDNEENDAIIVGPELNKKEMPAYQKCQKYEPQCVCMRFNSQCFCSRECSIFRSALPKYVNIHWKKALMLRYKINTVDGTVTTDRRNLRYA